MPQQSSNFIYDLLSVTKPPLLHSNRLISLDSPETVASERQAQCIDFFLESWSSELYCVQLYISYTDHYQNNAVCNSWTLRWDEQSVRQGEETLRQDDWSFVYVSSPGAPGKQRINLSTVLSLPSSDSGRVKALQLLRIARCLQWYMFKSCGAIIITTMIKITTNILFQQ